MTQGRGGAASLPLHDSCYPPAVQRRQYITTAIDYPNAAPHMGHVLEKVLADVLARHHRLNGRETRLQIGTDEHGIKIQQTADKQKLTPRELVDKNVPLFQDLYAKLRVSADHFVRTTDREDHWPTVRALWKKLRDAGALEKRSYTGLYCSGCERFVTAKDLVEGKCPDHHVAPQEVTEENWFFKLKDKEEYLKKILTDGTYRIVPEYRAAETMELLKSGLEDVSFSRPTSSLQWGIPVPDDDGQVMYVWCDALTNYVSTLGLLTDDRHAEFWNDAAVTHVIGKDIARFHALIWPAMLDYAGIRPPDRLLIHGFVTNEGQKMSKSLGNVVQPTEVLEKFGGHPDPIRFFLCHEIPVGRDGDFSWKRLEEIYQAKLANQLGNMLNRALVLLNKDHGVVKIPSNKSAADWIEGIGKDVHAKLDAFEVHAALQAVTAAVSDMNVSFNEQAPWKMKDDADLRISTLGGYAESLRHVALWLLSFIPDTAYRISKQLNVPYAEAMKEKTFVITDDLKAWGGAKGWERVGEPEILFKPLAEHIQKG